MVCENKGQCKARHSHSLQRKDNGKRSGDGVQSDTQFNLLRWTLVGQSKSAFVAVFRFSLLTLA